MTGTRQATPVLQSPFAEYLPQFSPDGQWLAYTSSESGREDVWVRRTFPNLGDRTLVSVEGGSYARWGHDGHTLFYRASDGRLMKRQVVTTGSSMQLSPPSVVVTRLPDAPANVTYPYDVAADGKILALTLPGDAPRVALNVLMNWQNALGRAAADVP